MTVSSGVVSFLVFAFVVVAVAAVVDVLGTCGGTDVVLPFVMLLVVKAVKLAVKGAVLTFEVEVAKKLE